MTLTTSTKFGLVANQPSDMFGVYTDGVNYYAVRSANEGHLGFVCKGKSEGIVISEAVWRIQQYLEAQPLIRPLPTWDNENKKVLWQ